MATKKINYHQNLQQNEIQNGVDQNLSSAPSTPKEGQFYWNTSTKEDMIYNGTAWVSRTNQGKIYTAGNGINTTSFESDEIAVYDASTTQKGIIEIATDTEASTGTDTTRAINAKQLATKVTANTAITGATHTKITYDAKGLVTSGADLQASDIPDISSTYQTKLSSTNKLSTDYISGLAAVATSGAYSSLTGTPTVDQTYSGTSTNAQSGVAVKSAIDTAISSVYKPAGSVAFANRPSLSSSIEGNVYNITDSFTTTSDFVEGAGNTYPAGTNIVCINTTGTTYKWDVLAGFIDTSSFITASSTATFTNKTFNANGTGNSITNLETADFASGVIQTSVRATSSASDTSLATEKAVATAITGMAKKFVATNPALTVSSGQCTWTISNTLGTEECGVFVKEVSSNEYVDCYYEVTSSNVIIKINSSSNITAGKYKAIIVG